MTTLDTSPAARSRRLQIARRILDERRRLGGIAPVAPTDEMTDEEWHRWHAHLAHDVLARERRQRPRPQVYAERWEEVAA